MKLHRLSRSHAVSRLDVARAVFTWRNLACLALVAATNIGCHQRQPPADVAIAPRNAELDRVHAACVEAMLKSTCKVVSGPEASSGADIIFVAGIGAVNAREYHELRASGDAMCMVVRSACEKDWAGAQCVTARALWPIPSVAPPP
jgi:hypothetical protein